MRVFNGTDDAPDDTQNLSLWMHLGCEQPD